MVPHFSALNSTQNAGQEAIGGDTFCLSYMQVRWMLLMHKNLSNQLVPSTGEKNDKKVSI
jgi:hypothetical protein